MCPWFDDFEEAIGGNAAIAPPMIIASSGPVPPIQASREGSYSPSLFEGLSMIDADNIDLPEDTSMDTDPSHTNSTASQPQNSRPASESRPDSPSIATRSERTTRSASKRPPPRSRKRPSLLDSGSDSDDSRARSRGPKASKRTNLADAMIQVAQINSGQAAAALMEQARIANLQLEAQRLQADERREQGKMEHEEKMMVLQIQLNNSQR